MANSKDPKPALANSKDPDQTAPEGAVWSGTSLFAIDKYFVKLFHNGKKRSVQNFRTCSVNKIKTE